ncbi:MAG: methyltransferase domain-containing protein [Acidobacteriota bacterium]
MPDEVTLYHMYSPEYINNFYSAHTQLPTEDQQKILHWLETQKPGTFVDYGCGKGALLAEVDKREWQAIGVEFDEQVAKETSERIHLPVFPLSSTAQLQGVADVLHIGDVIEHLTRIEDDIPRILKMIKPGGYLVAQGPLEGNANLYFHVIKLTRTIKKSTFIEMPPYHVLLATLKGQRLLFQRFGLTEINLSLSEIDWPAPGTVSLSTFKDLRAMALFLLRQGSKLFSSLMPKNSGNRYFYIGQWNG